MTPVLLISCREHPAGESAGSVSSGSTSKWHLRPGIQPPLQRLLELPHKAVLVHAGVMLCCQAHLEHSLHGRYLLLFGLTYCQQDLHRNISEACAPVAAASRERLRQSPARIGDPESHMRIT